jgi:hypothetical protein
MLPFQQVGEASRPIFPFMGLGTTANQGFHDALILADILSQDEKFTTLKEALTEYQARRQKRMKRTNRLMTALSKAEMIDIQSPYFNHLDWRNWGLEKLHSNNWIGPLLVGLFQDQYDEVRDIEIPAVRIPPASNEHNAYQIEHLKRHDDIVADNPRLNASSQRAPKTNSKVQLNQNSNVSTNSNRATLEFMQRKVNNRVVDADEPEPMEEAVMERRLSPGEGPSEKQSKNLYMEWPKLEKTSYQEIDFDEKAPFWEGVPKPLKQEERIPVRSTGYQWSLPTSQSTLKQEQPTGNMKTK